MKPQELFLKDGKSAGVFYCSNCKCVNKTKEGADGCCRCSRCEEKPTAKNSCMCMECRTIWQRESTEQNNAKEAAALAVAELVKRCEYFWYNDKMYSEVDSLIDDCECEGCSIPEYAFVMKPVYFKGFSLEGMFDDENENNMCEDLDIRDKLVGIEQLMRAMGTFNIENKNSIIYYVEDRSKKIAIAGEKDD